MGTSRALQILQLIVSIIVCQLAGLIGALFTAPAIPAWYATLRKPSLTPPGSVFGPVWGSLYLLMGIAAFLVWRQGLREPRVRTALALFGVQLLLNAAWSPVFFGLRSPLAGLAVIVPLWFAVLATIIAFFRVSRAAGALMLPYILWGSFAMVLNYLIFLMNP